MENLTYIQEVFDNISYTRKIAKGGIIYHQGDSALSFYYLKKGRVRVYMTSPDGVEHTLSTAKRGEILGEAAFFDKMPRISSAKALTNIEVAVINEENLLELTRKTPRLALELLGMQAARIRQLSSQIDSMTFLNAHERVARLLLENMSDKNSRQINLTHEEIAEASGVTRVTVSNILRSFKARGLIKTGYRKIIIISPEELKSI